MSLARNRTSANRLKIILDEDTDTYTMYFYRQTLTKCADIKVKDIARYLLCTSICFSPFSRR